MVLSGRYPVGAAMHGDLFPIQEYASSAGVMPDSPERHRGYSDSQKKGIKSRVADPVLAWFKSRTSEEQTFLGVLGGLMALALLWLVVEDHDNLFVMSEVVHLAGVAVLVFKLHTKKNCTGISLRTQELTAIFLAIRLYCSFQMEYNIHTVLDLLTLSASLYAIYVIRFQLKATYQAEQDSVNLLFVVIPCLVLALVAHPATRHAFVHRVMWAMCVYMEAVSVLPQLVMMQKSKVVERFTAHYVFGLGLARFLSCAHWVLQILDGDAMLTTMLWSGRSGLWPIMVLLSEIVQTFILADFCYHYVKAYANGTGIVRLGELLPI